VNVLLIMSDEHQRDVTGCYGHRFVRTPHLDRLAARGVVFENAYCNSPLCVPSRMSFMTGRYVHQIGMWDNGSVLDSAVETFAGRFAAQGAETILCGKMHFIGPDQIHGFSRREGPIPVNPRGDSSALHRDTVTPRPDAVRRFREAGMGDSRVLRHDEATQEAAVRVLHELGGRRDRDPFLLVVGYLAPHFPLRVPERYFELYWPDKLALPRIPPGHLDQLHPVAKGLREHFCADQISEEELRRCVAAYYGLVSYLDEKIGELLVTLEQVGLADDTLVIYTSDHGEMLGEHGMWWKCCMYEQAVAVPLIMRFPDGAAAGRRVSQIVELVDLYPTCAEALGLQAPADLPGASLLGVARGRAVDWKDSAFSEYHAHGTTTASYMIRKGPFKYVYHVGYAPELYDLREDPGEFRNLAGQAAYEQVMDSLHAELTARLDPEAVDQQAKMDQRRRAVAQETSGAAS